MKKIINALTVILITLSIFVTPLLSVKADGMVIRPNPNTWEYYDETTQQVYIDYEAGRETMLLSIGLSSMSDNLVWIFPVPAIHEDVVIYNNVTNMPNIYGTSISETAKDNISQMELLLSLNQIYPIAILPFLDIMNSYPSYSISDIALLSADGNTFKSRESQDTVTVYEHIEVNGIATELLTSDSSQVLQEYFDSKHLNITAGELTSLSSYYGDDNTLVVSYLTKPTISKNLNPTLSPTLFPQPIYYDQNETIDSDSYQYKPDYYNPSTRGLLVSFPTDRIYFPLVPTSVYGSKVVPAVIKVMGLVTPDIYKDIEPYTDVSYYKTSSRYALPTNFIEDGDSYLEINEPYTLIEINAPSKLLTEDLYIDEVAPIPTLIGSVVNNAPLLFFILPLLSNSILASIFSSLLIFKESRSIKIWKYGLLGLANIFSLIFMIIIVFFLPTKGIKEEDKGILDELKARGYNTRALRMADWRKLLFLPLFSIFYLILTIAGAEILKLMI